MSETHRISPEAVEEQLEPVTDPELDRSIVELEYIEETEIEGGSVEVSFVLPTAWCSPAFAWMMATDAREQARSAPGIETARVELVDHMHAEEITRGVNEGLAFETAFDEAEGGIDDLRRELLEKARLARQYDAVRTLREAGLDDAALATLTPEGIEFDGDRALVPVDDALVLCTEREPIDLYLDRAERLGLLEPGRPAFRDHEGEPIEAEEFELVQRRARLARTNISGQAGICAGLHESRQAAAEH